MKQEEDKFTGLPENAFRELKPGEVYNPLMGPSKNYPEVNIWSVAWGIAMAILFSAAAAYLGLKVGQVFEAAIPIAIIAVGVSGAAKRKNALGENVIIQSIGACSGVIVAGAIFTLPALYILQAKYPEMTVTFMQVFISSLLGGVLGILFLIPFRKYFVSDMHGKYPFPEATATTQVLISGEKGGSQAKPLLMAGMIGGLYDFIVATFGWWNENFTTRVCSAGEMLAEKAKLVFKVNTGAAVLGLGYIVGLKYASIICAGSLAVWWIIIPGMSAIWGDSVLNAWNPEITSTVGMMSPEEIFKYYAKSIGIGGIAMAGVIGIIRSWSIIKSAVGLAAKEMGGKGNVEKSIIRTQRDLSMKIIAIGSIITLILIVLFFYLDVMQGVHATGRRRMLGSFNHGSMANALPMAIGAALARPGQEVVALCGDGGLSMLLGDLATIVEYRLPVKIVVFNNRSLGMVKLEMEVAGLPDCQTDMCNPDFEAIARAMGITAFSVDDPAQAESTLLRVFDTPGPVLVSVQTDPNALAMPPKVEFEQMKGFALAMTKLILSGRTDEVVATAKSNLKHLRELV